MAGMVVISLVCIRDFGFTQGAQDETPLLSRYLLGKEKKCSLVLFKVYYMEVHFPLPGQGP